MASYTAAKESGANLDTFDGAALKDAMGKLNDVTEGTEDGWILGF